MKDCIGLHKKLAEQFRPLMGRESCFRTIPEGFDVRRDKENAGYRASIRDFMKEIGQGNCIIVAIT